MALSERRLLFGDRFEGSQSPDSACQSREGDLRADVSRLTGLLGGLIAIISIGRLVPRYAADSDDLARVYRFDLAQDSEMISPTVPI